MEKGNIQTRAKKKSAKNTRTQYLTFSTIENARWDLCYAMLCISEIGFYFLGLGIEGWMSKIHLIIFFVQINASSCFVAAVLIKFTGKF